ncbi:GyrI-like domain-containing protein [Herbiconiux moechotypicola]|uniref:GyrI-like domain-containing protein n=1 Tax=Herbiconiux moechotypicola TaxID=637393 RepID=A0ABP5QJ52_9MICO|nr:GyrI-like domain-containing protein [Herbiconiux moechotypicola]MCS5730028.1 GyrI-like domain-containing protein [Herbiconiux moechotypicola]
MAATGGDTKTDFKKSLDAYRPGRHHELRMLTVPPTRYLMVDGHGDPNDSPEFGAAVEAIFPVAYKLKFASKKLLGRDYVVMPLEGLWSAPDLASYTSARDKSQWDWTLLVMVPEWTTETMVQDARAAAAGSGSGSASGASVAGSAPVVRLETLDEGLCAQTLHVGPFDEEASILQEMHDRFIPSSGYTMRGRHHEIYLSDLRRTAPAKLRTLLRQPIALLPRG